MDEPTPSDMSEQRPRFRYVERGRTPLAAIDMSPITEDFSDPCQKITLEPLGDPNE